MIQRAIRRRLEIGRLELGLLDAGRSGSVLIEFALIAPILVMLLLGLYDLVPALMVRFKFASATQAVADLAAQSKIIGTSDIANFFAAGGDVMAPFSASNLVLRISNIATDGAGRAFVYWSCGQGALGPYASTSTVSSTATSPPTTIIANLQTLLQMNPSTSGNFKINGADTSFVWVESQYTFTPVAGFVLRSTQTLTGTAFALPRLSTYIAGMTGVPVFVEPAPTAIRNSFPIALSNVSCSFGY